MTKVRIKKPLKLSEDAKQKQAQCRRKVLGVRAKQPIKKLAQLS